MLLLLLLLQLIGPLHPTHASHSTRTTRTCIRGGEGAANTAAKAPHTHTPDAPQAVLVSGASLLGAGPGPERCPSPHGGGGLARGRQARDPGQGPAGGLGLEGVGAVAIKGLAPALGGAGAGAALLLLSPRQQQHLEQQQQELLHRRQQQALQQLLQLAPAGVRSGGDGSAGTAAEGLTLQPPVFEGAAAGSGDAGGSAPGGLPAALAAMAAAGGERAGGRRGGGSIAVTAKRGSSLPVRGASEPTPGKAGAWGAGGIGMGDRSGSAVLARRSPEEGGWVRGRHARGRGVEGASHTR